MHSKKNNTKKGTNCDELQRNIYIICCKYLFCILWHVCCIMQDIHSNETNLNVMPHPLFFQAADPYRQPFL